MRTCLGCGLFVFVENDNSLLCSACYEELLERLVMRLGHGKPANGTVAWAVLNRWYCAPECACCGLDLRPRFKQVGWEEGREHGQTVKARQYDLLVLSQPRAHGQYRFCSPGCYQKWLAHERLYGRVMD